MDRWGTKGLGLGRDEGVLAGDAARVRLVA